MDDRKGRSEVETKLRRWTEDGQVIAAKLLVYADEQEEYYTFITPRLEFFANHSFSTVSRKYM
jgi:hypothetical protein